MHSARALKCPAELLGASPNSGRLVEQWINDWPESTTTRLDLGRLLSWRCMLGALFECDHHRELPQIQMSPIWMWLSQRAPRNPDEPYLNVTVTESSPKSRRALFECDCHRELPQIQTSSLNSLKFSILQIWPFQMWPKHKNHWKQFIKEMLQYCFT